MPTPKTSQTKTNPKHRKGDLYRESMMQAVTDRIIETLSQGVLPWRRGWTDNGVSTFPVNAVTGRPYRGINVFVLLGADRGDDPRWCTQAQAEKQGWTVREDALPEMGCFTEPMTRHECQTASDPEAPDASDEAPDGDCKSQPARTYFLTRFFKLYHASDIDGIPPLAVQPAPAQAVSAQAFVAAEHLVAATGAVIIHGGNKAAYRPSRDLIQMPARAQFLSDAHYYGTMLHELSHWTGHASRLDRGFDRIRNADGVLDRPALAREELRAELGSAMLCAVLGADWPVDGHASYINSWLDALRQDKREIFRASADAQRIVDHLFTYAPELSPWADLPDPEAPARARRRVAA